MSKRAWYILLFALIFLLVYRIMPFAAFGLAAIVLLVWLVNFQTKKGVV